MHCNWRDIISALGMYIGLGDIMSALEGIMIVVEGYHQCIGDVPQQ